MKKLALRERARRLEEKVLADTERAKAAGGEDGDNPLESLEKGVIRCKVWGHHSTHTSLTRCATAR